jgi:hypothetical protein
MKIIEKPFDGYISNFAYDSIDNPTLNTLKALVLRTPPCLINFYKEAIDYQVEALSQADTAILLQEKEKDMGGLGKTILLERTRDFVYFECFAMKNHGKLARDIMPTIELAEQYITKQAILSNIVKRLCNIDSRLVDIFKTFTDRVNTFNDEQNAENDPSFIAEKLFDEATRPYSNSVLKHKNTEGVAPDKKNPFSINNQLIIFIDAFDAQYIGEIKAPFRRWLLDYLFPYLIAELNITIVVAGRGRVVINNNLGVDYKPFPVTSFNSENLTIYFEKYLERLPKELQNKTNIQQQDAWKSLTNELNQPEVISYIATCTEGKPILIDYFADLVYQYCLVHQYYFNLNNFIDSIKKQNTDRGLRVENRGESFKEYIIQGLYNRHQQDNEMLISETIKAIQLLSLFQHGLNAKDLAELVRKIDSDDEENVLNSESAVLKFFTFFKSENLSYVKDRRGSDTEKEPSIRLLHDETVFLYRKYYKDLDDPQHINRNRYIGYVLKMYERTLKQKEKLTVTEYNKKLLEYIEYSLTIYNRGKEQDAINRLLFEFSYYLDRHPDLCSRILEKGLNYYGQKKRLFEDGEEQDSKLTLTFSNDYALIAKLKLREVEYCLTERSPDNNLRIQEIIRKITDHIHNPKIKLTDLQRRGIEARCLVAEGERLFWDTKWNEGRDKVLKSRELFYRTGDSQGIIWAEHLLGFEAQRSGQFLLALRHHSDAIEAALRTFPHNERMLREQQFLEITDYGLLYRLRFLLRTTSRANGNWGVNLRYRGKVLEAIKLLESNVDIAELLGIRELVRVGSNIAQFNAIRGIESSFLEEYFSSLLDSLKISDQSLDRRLALTRTIFVGKQLGSESAIYVKNSSNFEFPKYDAHAISIATKDVRWIEEVAVFEGRNNRKDTKKHLYTEGVNDNPLLYLKERMPKKRPYLSLGDGEDIRDFKVTAFLGDVLGDKTYAAKWIGGLTREVADMYYQYGKMVLSTGLTLEHESPFEEALLAFENARYAAKEATFIYLQMEANEVLYRLCYLWGDKRATEYHVAFMKLKNTISKEFKYYGAYADLLSKFELTEGDSRLDAIVFSRKSEPELVLKEVFGHYANALYHAHNHNQERYLLILETFTERIRYLLNKTQEYDIANKTESFIHDFFNNTIKYNHVKISQQDNTFKDYLSVLLKAIRAERLKQFDIVVIQKFIRQLAEKGKFIKAAQPNYCLIRLFRTHPDYKNQLATRYFQQFFFYLGATQRRRITTLLSDMEKDFNLTNTEGGVCESFGEAVYFLISGTADYRSDEFWNMEKFVYGELQNFKIKFGKKLLGQTNSKATEEDCLKAAMAKFEAAEKKLIKSIKYFTQNKFNTEDTKISKKFITEGLFRIGELYILMELEKGTRSEFEQFVEKNIVTEAVYKTVLNNDEQSVSKIYKRSPSVHALNCAYIFAKHIGDKHREIDSWQSIANARYFLSQTIEKDNSTIEEAEIVHKNIYRIINRTHEQLRQVASQINLKNKANYPIVVSKSYLVEGDIHFSRLFEIERVGDSRNKHFYYKLREKWQGEFNENWQLAIEVKSILHEMLWCYLKGLDLLTDSGKVYENYHFNNMVYEINRRIRLIRDRELIRMLFEDLRPIWDAFPRLENKKETIQSFEFSMRIHELALASNAIFNNEK